MMLCLPEVVCLLQSVKKSPFRVALQGKWLFGCLSGWLRSKIRAHNKLSEDLEEQLLALFQYIYLFALYQSSSSNSHYKLQSTKVLSDLCLDKTRFLVIFHRKSPTLCS